MRKEFVIAAEPQTVPRLYAWRKPLIILACIAPLIAAGLLALLVNGVLLAPQTPGPKSSAADYYEFMANERGLPRLNGAQRAQFVQTIAERAVRDDHFADEFMTVMKRSPKDQQGLFRSNMVDAFLASMLADVRRYFSLSGAAQVAFLDDKIVEHKRNEKLFRRINLDKDALGSEKGNLLQMIMGKTSESEREQAVAYAGAMARRIAEILADDTLKKKFEDRLGSPLP